MRVTKQWLPQYSPHLMYYLLSVCSSSTCEAPIVAQYSLNDWLQTRIPFSILAMHLFSYLKQPMHDLHSKKRNVTLTLSKHNQISIHVDAIIQGQYNPVGKLADLRSSSFDMPSKIISLITHYFHALQNTELK